MLCKTWGSGYPDPLRTLAVVGMPNQAQATNGPEGSPQFVVAQIALGANGHGSGGRQPHRVRYDEQAHPALCARDCAAA